MNIDPKREELIGVLQTARKLLALPDNDFSWSGWEDGEAALREIDGLIARIRIGDLPDPLDLTVLFVVAGPIQETGLSSGWSKSFLRVAEQFDAAVGAVYGPGTA